MSQIAVDISRLGLNGQVSQAHVLGVMPGSREVLDIVALTRLTPEVAT